jgi:hypothetical protein
MRTKAALVSTLTAMTAMTTMIAMLFWNAAPAAACQLLLHGLEESAQEVLHGSPAEAAQATTELRQAGPAGMEALLTLTDSGDALDHVCGVRDCGEIHLFWYTDLEAAKAAARVEGKPILSLRLMGRLDEEFSCANSRFFRTVFYANREINQLLRDRFILHWSSMRPVPKVTIDFGDGTRLERTLTGNSIHYVLDRQGRLLEALPGLYGPETFQSALEEAARAEPRAASLGGSKWVSWMTARQESRLKARGEAFTRDVMAPRPIAAKAPAPAPMPAQALFQTTLGALTDRVNVGGNETGSKSAVEISILEVLTHVGDSVIHELAELRRPRVHLDAASRDFLLRKQGATGLEAERLADAFEATVALDEVINEYRTGPAILGKLRDPKVMKDFDLEAFNLWVYEDVFKTPLSDPWLGLAPEDVYGALPASARTASKP